MFKAKIKVDHFGCWACTISKKFKTKLILHNTTSIQPDVSSVILYCKGNPELQNQIHIFLKDQKDVNEVELLETHDDSAYFLVITSGNNPLIEKINNNRCFHLEPTVLLNGHEILIIGTKTKEKLNSLLEDLHTCGKPTLMSVVNYDFTRSELTKKQDEAVEHAYLQGYYEWPRNITTKELATQKGISKTTYVEHLRKGEIKILKQFIESH